MDACVSCLLAGEGNVLIGRNAEGNEREREEGGEEGLGWMVEGARRGRARVDRVAKTTELPSNYKMQSILYIFFTWSRDGGGCCFPWIPYKFPAGLLPSSLPPPSLPFSYGRRRV